MRILMSFLAAFSLAASPVVGNPGPATFTIDSGVFNVGTSTSLSLVTTPLSSLTGTIDAAGNVALPASGMTFNPTSVTVSGIPVTVQFTAVSDGVGTVNPTTGAVSVALTLQANLSGFLIPPGCSLGPVSFTLTSAGTGGVAYSPTTGQATIVDNTFAIPATTTCGLVSGVVNSDLALPSASGNNHLSATIAANPIIVAPPHAAAE